MGHKEHCNSGGGASTCAWCMVHSGRNNISGRRCDAGNGIASSSSSSLLGHDSDGECNDGGARGAVETKIDAIQRTLQELQVFNRQLRRVNVVLTVEIFYMRMLELVYWRDVKRSAVVFSAGLLALAAITLCSLLSLLAWASLTTLAVTLTYRIYNTVIHTVTHKGKDGGPYSALLAADVSLPADRVHQLVDVLLVHVNMSLHVLRNLFLVHDLAASLKFALFLYLMTYVGAVFNGYILLILVHVSVFTWFKIYETHKSTIDQYANLVCSKVHELTEKVREKIPMLKKKKKAE